MEQKTDSGNDARRLRQAFIIMLSFTLLLWTVKLVEYFGGLDLSWLGIYPRLLDGLAGVLSAPLVHGSFAHLFANTAPLIVIGTLLLYGYPRASRILLPAVYLLGGFAVWLFAREAYARDSAVAYGVFSLRRYDLGRFTRIARDLLRVASERRRDRYPAGLPAAQARSRAAAQTVQLGVRRCG
jgi:hypothetical protein